MGYSFAYSEDGVKFVRMGECNEYNGERQQLTDGMLLDAPAAPFKYLLYASACENPEHQKIREITWIPTTDGGGAASRDSSAQDKKETGSMIVTAIAAAAVACAAGGVAVFVARRRGSAGTNDNERDITTAL